MPYWYCEIAIDEETFILAYSSRRERDARCENPEAEAITRTDAISKYGLNHVQKAERDADSSR